MDILHKAKRYLVSGVSGTGKTEFSKRLLEQSKGTKFIFDHQEEMAMRLKCREIVNIDDILPALEKKEEYICFNPHHEFQGDVVGGFEWFCDYVYKMSWVLQGHKIFFSDEVQDMITSYNPGKGLSLILQNSRKQLLDSILNCQQTNRIHNIARNQYSDLVIFRQQDSIAAGMLPKSVSQEQLMSLQDGEFYHVRQGKVSKGKLIWNGSNKVDSAPHTPIESDQNPGDNPVDEEPVEEQQT
jgi:hypothetical protein